MQHEKPLLAIHGGAGALPADSRDPAARAELRAAVEKGLVHLRAGGHALDAVVAAVSHLEASGVFNAGRGAVRASDGSVTLDAAVMDGSTRAAGGVAALSGYADAVLIARRVMERTRHALLAGPGAEAFAAAEGFSRVPPDHFTAPLVAGEPLVARSPSPHGTVGAVARDASGRFAVATSTGGLRGKLPGRVGDSPLPGAGTWADDTCAVSATGIGEAIMRAVFGFRLAQAQRSGTALSEAASSALTEARALGGAGGCVAVNARGEVALVFDTPAMFRAYVAADGTIRVAITREEDPG